MLLRIARLFLLVLLSLALINCGGNNDSNNSNNNSGGNNSGGSNPGGSNPGGNGGGTGSGGSPQVTSNYVYTVSNGSLLGFKVSESGTFTAIANLNSPQQLRTDQLVASPDGRFLYSIQNPCYLVAGCTATGTNTLFVQTISTDGTLGTPTKALAGEDAIQIMVSPGSKWAFVLSSASTNHVTIHPINSDGTLGAVTGTVQLPMPTEAGNPYSTLAGISQSDTTLWVAEEIAVRGATTPELIAIKYDADNGSVLNTAVTDFSSQNQLESVAVAGSTLVIAEGTYWNWIQPNTVSTYRESDLNLLQRCSGATTPICNGVFLVTAHPTLPVVYTQQAQSNGGRTVSALKIGSDGSLTQVGGALTYAGAGYTYWTVHPEGTRLFLSRSDQNTITAVAVDLATGGLSELGSTTTSGKTGAIAVARR